MFLLRLIWGAIKGLFVGALVGYGLALAGMAVPAAWAAYPAAAVAGAIIALIAGKPIWRKGAAIEVGVKALVGALFAPGLLWLARSFVGMDMPLDVSVLPGLQGLSDSALTIGTFAMTSLAMVAGVLGGFYDADHSPADDEESGKQRIAAEKGGKARIEEADDAAVEAALAAAEAEGDPTQEAKRRS